MTRIPVNLVNEDELSALLAHSKSGLKVRVDIRYSGPVVSGDLLVPVDDA
jgi:hypothetical protein